MIFKPFPKNEIKLLLHTHQTLTVPYLTINGYPDLSQTLSHLLPSMSILDTRLHPVISIAFLIGECPFDHFVCRILHNCAVIIIFVDFGYGAQCVL